MGAGLLQQAVQALEGRAAPQDVVQVGQAAAAPPAALLMQAPTCDGASSQGRAGA